MAVAFDVVGTKGQNGSTTNGVTTLSTTGGAHNCAASDAHTVVIAIVQNYRTNTNTPTITCTYNGVAMTQLGQVMPSQTATAVFYMFNPPTGSKTVTGTATWTTGLSSGGANIVVTTQSYTGVDTLTNFNTSTATAVFSTTITTAAVVPTGGMAAFAHGTQVKYAGSLTYNRTLRFSGANTVTYTTFSYLVTGDAVGAGSTITSTASWPAGSGAVHAASVILNPYIAPPSNTGQFFAMF